MEAMDNAVLQDVVTALKEEIERHRHHVGQLQRENRALIRSILRLQKRLREQPPCHPPASPTCRGGRVHDDEEEEEGQGGSHEGDDASSTSPSRPSGMTSPTAQQPCPRCGAGPRLSTSSPGQDTASPTRPKREGGAGALRGAGTPPRENGTACEDRNEALQLRVKVLEKQLRSERLRRQTQAEEFTAELELLRFALDEAEQHAARCQPWSTDDAVASSQEKPLPSRLYDGGGGDGTSDSNLESHETFNKELTAHSRTSTTLSMENAETMVGLEGSDVPQNAALRRVGDPMNIDGVKSHDASLLSGEPGPRFVMTDPHSTSAGVYRDCMTSPSGDKVMTTTVSQLELCRGFPPVTHHSDTPPSEDFLSRAVSRMEGRRRRLRNAVMLRTMLETNDDNNGEGDDPAVDPPKEQVEVHMVAELPPNTELLPSTSPVQHFLPMREFRHLSHRGPFLVSGTSIDGACAGVSRGKSPTSASAGSGSIVNPNQLGVEVDPKGPHNRTWYAHQVLRVAFAKFILGSASSSSTACAATIAKSNSFERISDGCETDTFHEPQHGSPIGGHYLSSDTSSYSNAGEDRGLSMEERSCAMADDAVQPQTPTAASKRLYRNIPSAAVQRAIDETTSLHFRCCQNQPLLETGAAPFPPVLPLFHEENTDSELVTTFAMDPLSPSKYREDEIRLTLHSPVLFSQIRSFLGMDMAGFRASLGEKAVWRQAISPGKSGTSLIFFGNFVMKSLKEGEFKFLKDRFLRSYVSFCELHPDTMLPRFYALLSFSWLRLRSCTRYVLMQNVFSTQYYIHRIYDVKGSTVGRSTTTETAPRTSYGALLLKDNDLPAQLIICGPLQRAHVLAQFRSDINFLHSLNIVDYSCLIGVRSRVFSRKEGPSKTIVLKERRGSSWQQTVTSEAIGVGAEQLHERDNSCIHGCDGGLLSLPIYVTGDDTTAREDVYYLGIIDVLQEYTPAKRFENFAKGLWNDRRQISVVPPKEYAERLYKVLENITV